MIFDFLKFDDFFLNKESDKIFFFHIYFHICEKFQTKKKLVVTCIFECFQSYCHISKELHEFLCMINAIYGENHFI
jgi:hypothetical protein